MPKKILQNTEIRWGGNNIQSGLFLKNITSSTQATDSLPTLAIKNDGEVVKGSVAITQEQLTRAIQLTVEENQRTTNALAQRVSDAETKNTQQDRDISTARATATNANNVANTASNTANAASTAASAAQSGVDAIRRDLNNASRTTEHTITWQSGTSSGDNDSTQRRKLTFQPFTTLGVVHLDFRMSSSGSRTIGTLASDSPRPKSLIETQLWPNQFVYIEANSRLIKTVNAQANTRYIVDLVWFFNPN